jgi:uncharacterized protein YdaU (DUF1376 family)
LTGETLHYYKFNIADWSLSTAHLSLEEEAIYFRLINHYYDTESPIPTETQSVFRRLRMGNKDELALAILGEFFELTEKGWAHSRCEKDLKDYRKTAKKNKANGAKGGRPKKDAAHRETQEKPTGLPDESQNNPNHKPLTTNHKPLTKESRASRFTPPALTEVNGYFNEKGVPGLAGRSEAERFIDFYESKGWMVGKNKMKDWKAAVRNWLKRMDDKPKQPLSPMQNLTDTSWANHIIGQPPLGVEND